MLFGTSLPRTSARPRERLADVARYQGLSLSFMQRDLRTRFLGSRFGWMWSLINPMATLATYSVVFGILLGADRVMEPAANGTRLFAIYLFTGLVCWSTFASVLQRTVDGIIELIPLRRKVAFPVLSPLVGTAAATVVERAVELALLVGVYALVGNIGWVSLIAIPLLLLVAVFGFGMGLLIGSFNITFRDLGHFLAVALQLLFYATPVIYPAGFVEEKLAEGSIMRVLLTANPLAVFVDGLRDVLWSLRLPSGSAVIQLLAWTSGALALGWLVFRDRAYLIAEES